VRLLTLVALPDDFWDCYLYDYVTIFLLVRVMLVQGLLQFAMAVQHILNFFIRVIKLVKTVFQSELLKLKVQLVYQKVSPS
jgi:hypothetical protein